MIKRNLFFACIKFIIYEKYLPEEEYPILVMTILNGFKSDEIISNIINQIENKVQINDGK